MHEASAGGNYCPTVGGAVPAVLSAVCLVVIPVSSARGQQPTLRDSAGIQIVCNRVTVERPFRTIGATPVYTVIDSGRTHAVDGEGVEGVLLQYGRAAITQMEHTLTFFDNHGTVRFHVDVSQAESGADAFRPVQAISRDGDDILAWDGWNDRLMAFSPDGRLRTSRRVENPPMLKDVDARSRPLMIVWGRLTAGALLGEWWSLDEVLHQRTGVDSGAVVRIDPHGVPIVIARVLRGQRFSYCGRLCLNGQAVPFGRSGHIAMDSLAWYYADGSAFEISRFSPSGAISMIIRIDRVREPVTTIDIQRLTEARLPRVDPVLRPDWEQALSWMPYPKLKPAYTALIEDSDGELWARMWANDDEAATWDVFNHAGRYLGSVKVPADLQVLDVNRDYLLADHAHTFGLQDVRLYRLNRSAP